MSTVFVRSYGAPEFDRTEIYRYAGIRRGGDEFSELLRECINEAKEKLIYKVCFCEFPIKIRDDGIDLGFTSVRSADLSGHLAGADRALIFAATVGIELDRAIARYSRTSVSKALFFEAIGNERIEALCDAFCKEMSVEAAARGSVLSRRFSPGYGDLPLKVQRDIFRALDCPKKIGLSLNESLLMSPSKSVSAIIGISDRKL